MNRNCEDSCSDLRGIKKATGEMIDEDEVIRLSEVFKVLGDPTRIKIIYVLSKYEMCVCDIAEVLGMSQSAISHQLRLLRNLRLVKFRKEGKQAVYSLDDEHIVQLFSQGIEHIRHS